MRLVTGLAAILAIGVSAGLGSRLAAARQLDYRTLVESYRTGTASTTERIAAVPAGDLEASVERAVEDRTGAWDWQAIRAAAVLHTELWYRALLEKREPAFDHLSASVRLFERLSDLEPRQVEYIDRWRQIVAGLLPKLTNATAAANFVVRTAQTFPLAPSRQHAARAFAAGLDAERRAVERTVRSGLLTWSDDSPARWAAAAVSAYSEALKRDPSFEMASLHLGRVRMLQGNGDDAAPYFERATGAGDPRVRYLAHLFLGSLAERNARYAVAERAYLEAMRAYPFGQSASLALSQLLSRTGREADARQLLALFTSRKGGSVEPLWTYLPPSDPGLIDLQMSLDELRAEVRK